MMSQVIVLGSASAVPGKGSENTHLLIQLGDRSILIDSPGSPIIRLAEAGIDPLSISDIILTHFHPDHVSGIGPLLMGLWLMGKKTPLSVYGLEDTIERTKQMMHLYSWENWPGFYPVQFVSVPAQELTPVIEEPDLRILASPVQHLVPTIGLRMESGKNIIAYSCDTEPSQVVVRMAKDADVLIHEATGEGVGHTSPRQAGEVARQAGVKELYLIHYPPEITDTDCLVKEAQRAFAGPVQVAKDYTRIIF